LFSSYQIDEGTDLFLRTIDLTEPRDIIDMGCGCGVIGIVLAREFPEAQVISLDRDLLAVRYTRHNAALNRTRAAARKFRLVFVMSVSESARQWSRHGGRGR